MKSNDQQYDDKQLIKRAEDAVRICEAKSFPRFLGFLDQRQRELLEPIVHRVSDHSVFWGGYTDAERTVLGVFPPFMEPETDEFPITRLDYRFRSEDTLSHRDFLGCLLAQGIKRETIGDILVDDGRCSIFLSGDIAGFVQNAISKVGRAGIRSVLEEDWQLPIVRYFKEINDTIASPRLDCVIASLINGSRTQAVNLIQNGSVQVHFRVIYDTDFKIDAPETISVRGYGRFQVEAVGPLTKKGRLSFFAKKFV